MSDPSLSESVTLPLSHVGNSSSGSQHVTVGTLASLQVSSPNNAYPGNMSVSAMPLGIPVSISGYSQSLPPFMFPPLDYGNRTLLPLPSERQSSERQLMSGYQSSEIQSYPPPPFPSALTYLPSLPANEKTLSGLAPPLPPPPPPPPMPPSQGDLQNYLPPPPSMRIPMLTSQYLSVYTSKAMTPTGASPETVMHSSPSPSSPVPSVVMSPNTSKMLQSAIECSDENHLMPLSPGTESLPPVTVAVSHADCMYASSIPRTTLAHLSYEHQYHHSDVPFDINSVSSIPKVHTAEHHSLETQLHQEIKGLTGIIIEPLKDRETVKEGSSSKHNQSDNVFVKPKDSKRRNATSMQKEIVDPSPFLDPSSVEIEVGQEGEVSDEEQSLTEDNNYGSCATTSKINEKKKETSVSDIEEDDDDDDDDEEADDDDDDEEDEEDEDDEDDEEEEPESRKSEIRIKTPRVETPCGYESDSSLYSLIGTHKIQGSSVRHPILEPLYQREKNKIHKKRYTGSYHGGRTSVSCEDDEDDIDSYSEYEDEDEYYEGEECVDYDSSDYDDQMEEDDEDDGDDDEEEREEPSDLVHDPPTTKEISLVATDNAAEIASCARASKVSIKTNNKEDSNQFVKPQLLHDIPSKSEMVHDYKSFEATVPVTSNEQRVIVEAINDGHNTSIIPMYNVDNFEETPVDAAEEFADINSEMPAVEAVETVTTTEEIATSADNITDQMPSVPIATSLSESPEAVVVVCSTSSDNAHSFVCPAPVTAQSTITGRLVTIKKTQQVKVSKSQPRKALVIAPKPSPVIQPQVLNQPPIVIPLPQVNQGRCTILIQTVNSCSNNGPATQPLFITAIANQDSETVTTQVSTSSTPVFDYGSSTISDTVVLNSAGDIIDSQSVPQQQVCEVSEVQEHVITSSIEQEALLDPENMRSCQTPLPTTRPKNRIFKSKKDSTIALDTPVLDGPPTTKGIYCVDCNKMYREGCPQHRLSYQNVCDSSVLTRARMSLPSNLRLRSVFDQDSPNYMGVIAEEFIVSRTKFGPLIGIKTTKDNLERPEETSYVWELFDDGKPHLVLDCRNEEISNWMMFVKRARTSIEQNLMVYQQHEDIYFITCKDIQPGTELLYWYARDYARMLGVATRPEDFFRCPHCHKQFPDLRAVKQHIKYLHPNVCKRRHKCVTCGRAFSSNSKLNSHMLLHMGVKPYTCQHCNKSFRDNSNLKKHERLHSEDCRRFACPHCDKKFNQKHHLQGHMNTHTKLQSFQCRFCEKSYSRQYDLRVHEYSHTYEKFYTCDVCGKNFFKLQNFKKHGKIHSGLKEFVCSKCSKAFHTKYHLERHVKKCNIDKKSKKGKITPRTNAELGLSVAKKRIVKAQGKAKAAAGNPGT